MIVGNDLITLPVWVPEYLIRDEFLDNHPAGTVNNTAATPGPGTRTVVDTGNLLSVGGDAAILVPGSATNGDPALRYGAIVRSAGLAMIYRCTPLGTGSVFWDIGFDSDLLTEFPNFIKWHFRNESSVKPMGNFFSVASWVENIELSASIILRSTGAFYFIGSVLHWVEDTVSTTPVYPGVSNVFNANFATGSLRVIQLPAPFDTDDGLATDTHSGSVAAGTTFTHESDFVLEFTVDTLPSSRGIEVHFRKQDSNNLWDVYIDSAGSLYLFEAVAGGYTGRGAVGGAVANGSRVVVIADNESIKIFTNNTLRISYGSATNFKTATTGYVYLLGPGSAVSDLKTWPRTLSGRAKQILDIASQ